MLNDRARLAHLPLTNQFAQSTVTLALRRRVLRLGNAVGIEDQGVAGLQARFLHRELLAAEHAEGQVGTLQDLDIRVAGNQRRQVASVYQLDDPR